MCAQTTGHALLVKLEKCQMIVYLIGIGHEKQLNVRYWYQLRKIHIVHLQNNN